MLNFKEMVILKPKSKLKSLFYLERKKLRLGVYTIIQMAEHQELFEVIFRLKKGFTSGFVNNFLIYFFDENTFMNRKMKRVKYTKCNCTCMHTLNHKKVKT